MPATALSSAAARSSSLRVSMPVTVSPGMRSIMAATSSDAVATSCHSDCASGSILRLVERSVLMRRRFPHGLLAALPACSAGGGGLSRGTHLGSGCRCLQDLDRCRDSDSVRRYTLRPMNDTGIHQNELSRSLRPRHVSMITIGGIIGAGLFVGSSVAIAAAGPAIIVSYVLTGLLILLVMRMLGEMAVEMPQVRSFTEFTRAALGNWAGFSIGWLYWYFWAIVIPVEAIAGAGIIQRWLPLPMWEIGTALMLAMTFVNLLSARAYGEFEFWFASIKVAAIVTFIIVVGAYVLGYRSPTGPTFSNLAAYGGFAPKGGFAVLASVTTVIWSMMGAEVVTIAAAESPEPARAIAKMTSTIISRILIFYVLSIFVITCVVPWNRVVSGQSPFTLALDQIHFPYASTFMAAVILTAVLSCLNSSFYVASRVLFVLASRGDAPRWLV